jgi:signal transduction histidine kinase
LGLRGVTCYFRRCQVEADRAFYGGLGNMPQNPMQDKFAQWSALVGGLAHELKNPLSTMNINLQLLREDWAEERGPLANRSVRKIDVMLQESHRLEQMLSDFLRLTSPAPLDLKILDPSHLLEDVFDFMSSELRKNNIDVDMQLDSGLGGVSADENLLRQALINLVKNSMDAIDDNGGTISAHTRSKDGNVLIEIIDTGCGMSEETLAQVFRYYYSTKSNGTGLGLPMVDRLMARHGGEVLCESSLGRGTKFTLVLPRDNGGAE